VSDANPGKGDDAVRNADVGELASSRFQLIGQAGKSHRARMRRGNETRMRASRRFLAVPYVCTENATVLVFTRYSLRLCLYLTLDKNLQIRTRRCSAYNAAAAHYHAPVTYPLSLRQRELRSKKYPLGP